MVVETRGKPETAEKILKFIDGRGMITSSQIYEKNDLMPKHQYYGGKNVAEMCGFLENGGGSVRILPRGEDVVAGGERKRQAYRDAIAELNPYKALLTQISEMESAETIETTAVSWVMGQAVSEFDEKETQDATALAFRIFARAGLGNLDDSGRTNKLEVDQQAVKEFISGKEVRVEQRQQKLGSKTPKEDPEDRERFAELDFKAEELRIRIPSSDMTMSEIKNKIKEFGFDSDELEVVH